MNEENLIPFNQRTESEQREIARKGGVASGKARREYSSLKKAAKAYLKENGNAAMGMIEALAEKALDGDVKALTAYLDLIGETAAREELKLKADIAKSQRKQISDNTRTSKLYDILSEETEDGSDN